MHRVFQQTSAAARLRALRRTKIPELEESRGYIRHCASAEECDGGSAHNRAPERKSRASRPSVAIYYLLIKHSIAYVATIAKRSEDAIRIRVRFKRAVYHDAVDLLV